MKAVYGWLMILIALVAVIGCGGGGGGGGTDGTTNGTTNGGNGRVLRDTAGTALGGTTVFFYNNAGNQIGQATTAANGRLPGIPGNAVFFTVNVSSAPNSANYFQQFTYNSKEYLANDDTCLARISGTNWRTDVVLTLRWMGPPPPPGGCLTG